MSYSRWSDSDWYTFWYAGTDAELAMWHCGNQDHRSASYEQLKEISEDQLAARVPGSPRDDVPELLGYVREFCADVEERRAIVPLPLATARDGREK